MSRAVVVITLLVFPCFAAARESSAPAQPAEHKAANPRLKIGVALEGGGALGLAHIGVLQWPEENHVPIDYIAGTSMGGLVGGFYAAGMSPEELKKLIAGVNWDDILRDRIPYQELSFSENRISARIPIPWCSACAKDCISPPD